MKKIIKKLSFLALLCGVMMMVSCHKADLSADIPYNSTAVVTINIGNLIQKGELNKEDNYTFMKLLRQEMQSEDAQAATIIDGLIKDPASMGIDLRKDLVMFFEGKDNAGVLASIKSKSKFEDFIKTLADDEQMEIKEVNGVSTTTIMNGLLPVSMAWDKKKALLIVNKNVQAVDMMNLKKEQSMASNKDFMTYWKNRGDISYWMGMDNMMEIAENIGGTEAMAELPQDYLEAIRDVSVYGNVNFEKGAIRMSYETLGLDKNSELMKMVDKDFNGNLLSFMPEKTFAVISFVADFEYLTNYLASMDEFKKSMNEEITNGLTVGGLMKAINGSMVASIHGFGNGADGSLVPLFTAAIDLTDASKVNDLLAQSGMQQEQGCYVISSVPLYMGIKDNVFFVTDDADVAQKVQQDGYKNGLKDHAKNIKKGGYLYGDLSVDHYPANVTGLIPDNISSLLRQYLDKMEMVMTSKTSCDFVLHLADKTRNSLAATLHFVDDNLMNFANLAGSLGGSSCPVVEDSVYVDEEYFVEE